MLIKFTIIYSFIYFRFKYYVFELSSWSDLAIIIELYYSESNMNFEISFSIIVHQARLHFTATR